MRKQSPFDLELALARWRKATSWHTALTEEDRDELVQHIRDQVDELRMMGLSEAAAYRQSIEQMGPEFVTEEAYRTNLDLLPHISLLWSMFKSYLMIAWRNLLKHKGFSTLNIAGLAIGLACSFFIVIWIQHELQVDQFHTNSSALYQLRMNHHGDEQIATWSNLPLPLAQVLEDDLPEVERAVVTLPITAALKHGEQGSREVGYYAGAGFFEAFTFPVRVGDPATALLDPTGLVITESLATKYFGVDWQQQDILGASIRLDYWQSNGGVLGQAIRVPSQTDFTVAAVVDDPPATSSLQFDFVLPIADVIQHFPHIQNWGPRWFEMYVLAAPRVPEHVLATKVEPLLGRYAEGSENQQLIVQPFAETYLYGSFEEGQAAGGRITQLYLMGLVGLALLLIACINFTNLVTARSNQRAREIGVRKALGATPSFLIQQFLGEAMLTALVAFGAAVVLMALFMPLFNGVVGTAITLGSIHLWTWLAFAGLALGVGFVAGSYPAFYLASLQAVRAFQHRQHGGRTGAVGLRKGLVVLQFVMAAFLIVGTLTIYQQLHFLQTKSLGVEMNDVVRVRLEGNMADQYTAVRDQLMQLPAITSVARSNAHPLNVTIKNSNVLWAGKEIDEPALFKVLDADAHFVHTMQLPLVAGRFFDDTRDRNTLSYVINESAVQAMGLENPIGHPFAFGYDLDSNDAQLGQIIGVVKDFHSGSLKDDPVGPLAFRFAPDGANFLLVRTIPGRQREALMALETIHDAVNPGYLFEYAFLEEEYAAYYRDEQVLGQMSQVFAGLAIFIACLGLLGLVASSVQQRTKEVGIRRVMGATNAQVLYLISSEFLQLVAVSMVVALPLAYWALDTWLLSFVYRIDIGIGILGIATVLSLGVAAMTVSVQALRALRRTPVEALRYE